MAIIAKDKGGGDFKIVPAGTHIAICNMVIDCGVQSGGKYKPKHQIYIRWEIPGEVIEWEKDGQQFTGPMNIGKFYTLSLSEKAALRADLESWRGKTFTEQELDGFDVVNILGKPCMLGVTHNKVDKKTYANISAVMGLPKGTPVPSPANELLTYSPDDHSMTTWNKLPEWLQEKISERVKDDASQTVSGGEVIDPFDDDIPF